MKDYRGEGEDIRIIILPAAGVHPRLAAGLLKKGLPVPFLFHRHLRKQQALAVAVLHQQSVLANLDLLNIGNSPQRREH